MRPIHEIAREIRRDWKVENVYFGAVPYLEAMRSLEGIDDTYGCDPASEIIAYFLSNAKTWKGETARTLKNELREGLGLKSVRAPSAKPRAQRPKGYLVRVVATDGRPFHFRRLQTRKDAEHHARFILHSESQGTIAAVHPTDAKREFGPPLSAWIQTSTSGLLGANRPDRMKLENVETIYDARGTTLSQWVAPLK